MAASFLLAGFANARDIEDDEVVFELADCDVEVVEDRVNQRLGHYAYPWISYARRPRVLAVGDEREME